MDSANLQSRDILIRLVDLDEPPDEIGMFAASLTDEERIRAERYRPERARRQFVIGRGMLRRLLGDRLGVAPCEVPITYTGAGKPILADENSRLHFNVSHTDGLAVIALSDRVVGVDIERLRTLDDPEGLVGRFFSPRECAAFLGLPAATRPAGFFRGWTCKEALIKASGLSVAYLDRFDVELDPSRPAALVESRHPSLDGTTWSLTAWEPRAGYAAAIAVGN